MKNLGQYKKCEVGATAVEYAIMVGFIAVVIVASVQAIGTTLIPIFADAASWFTGS